MIAFPKNEIINWKIMFSQYLHQIHSEQITCIYCLKYYYVYMEIMRKISILLKFKNATEYYKNSSEDWSV
jgi:hypothetical protein